MVFPQSRHAHDGELPGDDGSYDSTWIVVSVGVILPVLVLGYSFCCLVAQRVVFADRAAGQFWLAASDEPARYWTMLLAQTLLAVYLVARFPLANWSKRWGHLGQPIAWLAMAGAVIATVGVIVVGE